ncbi:MAG: type II toxin-antitoxin system Phd/YefM family antitoxin [Thermodesulfobacteriota bacterium]|jgi:prevent-host-death family protein
MEQSISATEARVHFGQWLRRVKEQNMTLIVERGGSPEAVLLSMAAYGKLQEAQHLRGGLEVLARARALRETIRARRSGRPLPAPEDVIAEMREERTDELAPVR